MQGSGPQGGGPAARSVEVSLCVLVPRPYPKGDERKKACLSALSEVKVQPGERGGAWWEGGCGPWVPGIPLQSLPCPAATWGPTGCSCFPKAKPCPQQLWF